MKIARYSLMLLLALLVAAAPVSGAARYRVTEIVLPTGGVLRYESDKYVSINNQGVVAGWYHIQGTTSDTEAYRWENGVLTPLPHLLGNETFITRANAINNQGQIAGFTATPISAAPCRWQGADPFTPAPLPDGGGPARGINYLGYAVGIASNTAVLWQSDSRTFLPTLETGGFISEAFGINKDGLIVGYASNASGSIYWPVLWRDDDGIINIINLGDLCETSETENRGGKAFAINDHNQVVGYARANVGDFGESRAFLWENGAMRDLKALFENTSSYALAINNLGQIVGKSYSNVPPYGDRAMLWEKGSIIDLNTKIDPIPGWCLVEAQAINDRGQIVCVAWDSLGIGPNLRIFLLTPVSSPAAMNLLLLDD